MEKAKIAKGSVYQYFDNKKELYLYLVKLAAEIKFAYVGRSVDHSVTEFYEKYKMLVFYGAQFDFTQPRYANILYHATYEPTHPDVVDISEELKDSSYQFINASVEEGIHHGQIRRDISLDFIVFAFYELTVSLRDYLNVKFNFSFKDAVLSGIGSPVGDEELKAVLDELVGFIRQGMQADMPDNN